MSDATPVHIGAVDLGASSGRVMVGTIADGTPLPHRDPPFLKQRRPCTYQ